MIALFVDADACPVKQEICRVAERHALKGTALKVFVVTNSPIAVPRDPLIERVVVGAGMDEADNWITERAGAGAIVITADTAAGEPRREGGRRGNCAERPRLHRGLDRHDVSDAQPDGFVAQRRRDHRRPKTVLAARPLELSLSAGSGHRAAQARGVRPGGRLAGCGGTKRWRDVYFGKNALPLKGGGRERSERGGGPRRRTLAQALRPRTPTLPSPFQGEEKFAGRKIAMIRKLPSGKYRLYSRKKNPKTGRRRNLGTFASRAAAEKHERAVQYFKRH
jgi:hypothetical protein